MCYEISRIQELCDERGWSHYKLAKKMDSQPSNIYNLMRRPSTPSVDTLRRACSAFGITMEQFYHTDQSTCIADPKQVAILKKYLKLTQEKRRMVESFIEGLDSAE